MYAHLLGHTPDIDASPTQSVCRLDESNLSAIRSCTALSQSRKISILKEELELLLTDPATPPLPPPIQTMSYLSRPGLVTGGMFGAAEVVMDLESYARVRCPPVVALYELRT